jgi:carbon-monoxide dehydrogenase large subunit/6-hydroxypseudooxynicotine dehydrogenase subunit gamma
MTAPVEPQRVIGLSLPRKEDLPLVSGRARFAADINFPHQLHMRIVRSNVAHGIISSIDTTAAAALPGVYAVWAAADVADLPPIEFREGPIPALAAYRQRVLADGTVRYVGDPVAAVFAESATIAEDAADLVTVEIDELPPILSADTEPGLFAPGLSTEATICQQGYGDVEAALKAATHVLEVDVAIGRHSAVPIETRGAIGRYDAARDVLELHGAGKVPHKNRETLAKMLGLAHAQMQVFEAHVGGGFGVRGELYPEDILVLVATLRFDRPVKWIEDRREHLMTANHSRQQHHKVRVGFDADGRMMALDDEFYHDQGGYIRTHATRIADMTCGMLPGAYHLGAYRALCHFRLTNKTPAATYRAPGRYESNFVRERVMDAIAAKLGITPLEVRRRNLIKASEMPFERPLVALGDDIVYDSGDYDRLLDELLARFDWEKAQRDAAVRRAKGELVGLGCAVYIEKSGLGPVDGAKVSVDPTGAVEVITGGASVGQGFETVMAQVCAEVLGVAYDKVRVVHGRTDRLEFGLGAHASRATVMSANATAAAAQNVRTKALTLAATLMQLPIGELTIVDGVVQRMGGGGPTMDLAEVAKKLAPFSPVRGELAPGLTCEGWFRTAHQTYPYGAMALQIVIDKGTGKVTVERGTVVYDVGRAIHPGLIAGQIQGGFVQGLGGALLEEFLYDDAGQPLCATLADYLLPSLADAPRLDIAIREDAPSTCNPLGIKGAGESGISAVGAVIASAVDDALQMPGAVTSLPLTPARVMAMIEQRH